MINSETMKQLNHCTIAVRDWLAGGCDTNDIPRPEIAVLVAFCKEVAQAPALPLRSEFDLRVKLATLKCWHRLTGEEADDLVRFAAAKPAPQKALGWLVTDDEGNDDFVNNLAALHGRHYKGGEPISLVAAATQPAAHQTAPIPTAHYTPRDWPSWLSKMAYTNKGAAF